MNRKGSSALWIGAIALVLLVGVGFLYSTLDSSKFSIIGEEGYESPDPLLSGGAYDKAWWSHSVSCAGQYGERASTCAAHQPYAGVAVQNGMIVANPLYGAGRVELRTGDLRLVDFRFTAYVLSQRGGTGQIATSNGVLWSHQSSARSTDASGAVGRAGVELSWDDYELGHYQIKVNGVLVQEGTVPEGQEFRIIALPYSAWSGDMGSAAVGFENPRLRALFSCDPQAGTVKVHECFAGPDRIGLSDLDGFERFCTSLPATFSDAGLVGSSKRVYYELARDGRVDIEKNQVWEFQYLGNAAELGVPASQTGVVELCEEEFTPIEDVKDLPIADAVVTERSIAWTSYARYYGESKGYGAQKDALRSGDQEFMTVSDVVIDEASCPYTAKRQTYPGSGLSSSCFTVTAFDHEFTDGSTFSPASGVTVTLVRLDVQFEDEAGQKERSHTARWLVTFDQNVVRTSFSPFADMTDRGDDLLARVVVENRLPGPATFMTSTRIKSEIVGESVTRIAETELDANQRATVIAGLPRENVGDHTVTAWTTLQTEYGNIAFASASGSYEVLPDDEPAADVAEEELGLFARFLQWLRGVFA